MMVRIRQWWQTVARSGKEPALRHVDRLPLTAQHVLHCVEYQGQQLLVATHPGGATLLSPGPREPESMRRTGAAA